jgi:hypothetical protein
VWGLSADRCCCFERAAAHSQVTFKALLGRSGKSEAMPSRSGDPG